MRIAIIHFAGPPIVGGVESTIYHHARLLSESGFGVDVIAGRGDKFHPDVEFHLVPEIDSRHDDILETGGFLAEGRVVHKFYQTRDLLYEKIKTILLNANARACLVHNAMTLHKNLPLTASLRLLNDRQITKFIAWCHDFAWLDRLYTPEMHDGYPWDLLKNPWDGVKYVVVSEHRGNRLAELLNLPIEEIEVINPGVDIYQFFNFQSKSVELVEKLDLLSAEPLILLPARITRRKNIEFGIRVTAALKQMVPDVRLLITGPPGPHNPKNQAYLESLMDLRERLSIHDDVNFLYECGEDGEPLIVSDQVIFDLYQICDVLLFPSFREGFGIPILEAGLVRMPIFAADIPSIRKTAGEGAYLFDPNGDPDLVGEAIYQTLIADKAYNLRRKIIRHYSWKAIVSMRIIPLIKVEAN